MSSSLLSALLVLGGQGAPATVELPYEVEATAELQRVVDGDTLEVLLDGEKRTLRLSSVDTEEKISGRPAGSPTKPETVFGQETALWARDFFAELGSPARIGLAFPEGRREDAYGRLLCHVLLSDGRDFNLLLVEQGKSPYFNKYGNCPLAHEAFVRAQEEAQRRQLGIWNPATNRARTPGVPSAVRPYAELLPWWNARAEAIDRFRSSGELAGGRLVSAEDPAGLERAFRSSQDDPALRITVFGTIRRFFDEADGSLTVLLRDGDARQALRARVPKERRGELEGLLRQSCEEFRQNYLYAEGTLTRNTRGYLLVTAERSQWRAAEPEYSPPGGR